MQACVFACTQTVSMSSNATDSAFFFLSVSLSCCLDNWPQRCVHVHAIVINPAFNLQGTVRRDTSNASITQVPVVT